MKEESFKNENDSANFIHQFIAEDLGENTSSLITRFPPEPNGFLHIGHAKSIILNSGLAKQYNGTFNLRFDDTNPAKEESMYVKAIVEDVKWLGADYNDKIYQASDYFDVMFDCALILIEKGLAYVCELTAEEVSKTRGTLTTGGTNSPYRDRPIEENKRLFLEMRDRKHADGSLTLRAKIDMSSPNINMRDPVIYRIARLTHHNTGDKWCVYPMYDYAHPIEDAIEGITHSICTLEFEAHRPLYNWVIDNCCSHLPSKPRQIEFAKLSLTNTIMGKRYLKALVDNGEVDGWDDPRLATISGIRRRGYTPASIRDFCDRIGVSKANNKVDYALLEHCVREDLKTFATNKMCILEPLKVVITNYPENETEYVSIENSQREEDGNRDLPFGREIYIEKSDFLEDAPSKFHRLTLDKEVRLKGAYFIKCNEVIKDENGEVVELHCTYDVETKSGTGFTGRKVKGTIHWLEANSAIDATVRKFNFLITDDESEEAGYTKNENTLETFNAKVESSLVDATCDERFQFIRNGFYCTDSKLSTKDNLVFNEVVSLKSSFKM